MTIAAARERRWLKKTFLDKYQKTNQFVVVALTSGYILTKKEASAFEVGTSDDDSSGALRWARVAFRGRVIGPNSPHLLLTDPCSLSTTANPLYVSNLIVQHTEFILTEDFFDQSAKGNIERDDKVNVYLEPGPGDQPFNLERGWAISLHKKRGFRRSTEDEVMDCTSIKDIWDNAPPIGGKYEPNQTGVPINFSQIQHTGDCAPANASAKNVKDYFGPDGWAAYIEELGKHENPWDADQKALESRGTLASPAGMLGRYQFSVESAVGVGIITKAAVAKHMKGNDTQFTCKLKDDGTYSGFTSETTCKARQKQVDDLYKDSDSWTGKYGDNLEEFLGSKDIQNDALATYVGNPQKQKARGTDMNNAQDVAGMMAASHLVGGRHAANLRKGLDTGDGNGHPASAYYIDMGNAIPCKQ
jgi:hypothetical protein